jgi:hypothetical protein
MRVVHVGICSFSPRTAGLEDAQTVSPITEVGYRPLPIRSHHLSLQIA